MATGTGWWAMSKRRPEPGRSESSACRQVEVGVPGLHQAVEALCPAEQRRFEPLDDLDAGDWPRAEGRSATVRQQGVLVAFGEPVHPLVGDPCLTHVAAVDAGGDQQDRDHERKPIRDSRIRHPNDETPLAWRHGDRVAVVVVTYTVPT